VRLRDYCDDCVDAVGVAAAIAGASTRTEVAILWPSFSSHRTATRTPTFRLPPVTCVALVRRNVVSRPELSRTTKFEAAESMRATVPDRAFPWLFGFAAVGAGAGAASTAARTLAERKPIIAGYPTARDVNAL